MDILEQETKLINELGTDYLLDQILQAMTHDEKKSIFEYIARMWDVEI